MVLFAAAVAVALLAATPLGRGAHSSEKAKTAAPADALVLGRREVPGLRPVRTTPKAATTALDRALSPADFLPIRGVQRSASRFVGEAEVWSLALLHGTPRTARTSFARWAADIRSARLRTVPARVGQQSRVVIPESGGAGTVVLWRRDRALSAIILRGPRSHRVATNVAIRYARALDARQEFELTKTAWQRTLDEVTPNGRVRRATALKLFALAYGPLPGVARPAGPRDSHTEGTLAGGAILEHWRTLTPAQRAAAGQKLGIRNVGAPRRRPSKADGAAAPPTYGDSRFHRDRRVEQIVRHWITVHGRRMGIGHRLAYTIVAGNSPTIAGTDALADAYPVTAAGDNIDGAPFCRVRIVPGALASNPAFANLVLAHEAFHCWQFDILGSTGWHSLPLWVREGGADWAALAVVHPPFDLGGGNIQWYVNTPDKPLFQRSYDGVGFWARAEQATGNLFPRWPQILKAAGNEAHYAAAGGDLQHFQHGWGSNSWNSQRLGFDWTIQKPIAAPNGLDNPFSEVTWSKSEVRTGPFTIARYIVAKANFPSGKPLLHFQIPPFARLANSSLDTMGLTDAWFCLKDECKCPPGKEGNPPPAPPIGAAISLLALSGGRSGVRGFVTARSLDDFCKKKDKPPARPPASPPMGGGGPSGGGGGSRNSGCSSGCGGSNGDPHLTTFDGRFYDHQAAGEFILATADDLEVQVREEPYPGSKTLSVNTAVAMRVGRDRVAVYRGRPLPVRVNGTGFVPSRRYTKLPRGGGWIRSLADQVEVWWADGTVARVWPVEPWGVSVLVKPSEQRRGALRGLLGNFDGSIENDFVTREGRNLPDTTPSNYRLLYRVLGESWRIRQSESLLDYARGQSTNTFTDRRFPAQIVTPANLPASDRAEAERACARLGISDPRILQGCLLDVAGTGDNAFATNAATVQRTGKSFRGAGGRTDQGVTRWAELASGGRSNSVTPSVALSEGKVVVAFSGDGTSAEAVTFTPSRPRDAVEIRRNILVSGWALVDDPVLVERPGGGLQALVAGFHSTTTGDPLNATSILIRNPDGSFGPPVPVTTATDLGHAVQAPDGQPLWTSNSAGGLYLWRGSSAPANSDLSSIVGGTSYIPTLGRDGLGRYWLAWYVLAGQSQQTGIYMVQIDPGTLQPLGPPQQAPRSGTPDNSGVRITLACAATCRAAYLETTTSGLTSGRILTWAHGAGAPTVIARGRPDQWLAAAYTSAGRLWIVWFDEGAGQYRAVLGNASGAGGRPFAIGRAATAGRGFALTAISVGNDLVVVTNWARGSVYSRLVNVVAPPGG